MEGRQFNRRTLAILVVLTALLLLFFGVLYNLQVLHVDDYRAQSVVKIANRKTVEAARGELLDRYGRSMVTNRATYQLTLNTGVMGEEAVRNANLLELLNICRDNGLTWTDTLAVSTAAPFTYTSDTPLAYEKEGGGVALTRLGRLLNALPMKKELKSSLNLPTTEQVEDAKTLDDIPAGPTAEELIAALRTYFEIDPSWSDADARALIGVLYETNLRTYSINQQAYIFAQDVNIDVISAVKERRLTGVTIETTTVRQYNTVAAAHLLGHVGDIQSSNWDYYREQGYSMNDKVGIDGAENAFEEYLRGESGVQIQELSTSGKVVSEYWRIDPETGEEQIPKPGDNVLLTLDLRLQEKVEEILKIAQDPVSLETPIGEEEDSHLGDFIPDEGASEPSEAASYTLLKEQLVSVLSTLTPREEKVLKLRFGLEDGRTRTLEEVGKEFNVTRERIRQIEAKALRKLRHPSRSKKLKDFLN